MRMAGPHAADPPTPAASATTDAAIELAPGFRATAAACGLKAGGAADLALIVADGPAAAAGIFTTNRVVAAPVRYDRAVLEDGAARVRVVVANAGCANACTGARGDEDARAMAALAAAAVGCEAGQVLVLSTGVIGRRLDLAKVARGIEGASRPGAASGALAAARAIMTTDTSPKLAAGDFVADGRTFAIRGIAKGSGMIHPDLATMLAVITTDAELSPPALRLALVAAAARSFNRVSVDGDTSTNDTVLLLASGAAGPLPGPAAEAAFSTALAGCATALARQIARDGEGATRLVEITVEGAADEEQAYRVADRIARSPLVKTAIHGGDPNWGRVLAAAGASGVVIDPARLTLAFGPSGAEVRVVAGGEPLAHDEAAASAALRADPACVRLGLGLGGAAATVWTCDLSADYVAINAHYTT
jgi:glutamate N-acetyltransferase/amino-acid N-acetyltransferase